MTQRERDSVWAYLIDRSQQYSAGSGIITALENVAVAILGGEVEQALKHGELDDLIADLRSRRNARVRK